MSNSLDPDDDRQNVGPDLGSNCLQILSAEQIQEFEIHSKGNNCCNSNYLIVQELPYKSKLNKKRKIRNQFYTCQTYLFL